MMHCQKASCRRTGMERGVGSARRIEFAWRSARRCRGQWMGPRRKMEGSDRWAVGTGILRVVDLLDPDGVVALQAARQLSAHAKNFDMPLPPTLVNDTITVDPTLSWQMGVKLIDLVMLQVKEASALKLGRESPDRQLGGNAIDLAMRYSTYTARELERSFAWFENLRRKVCNLAGGRRRICKTTARICRAEYLAQL